MGKLEEALVKAFKDSSTSEYLSEKFRDDALDNLKRTDEKLQRQLLLAAVLVSCFLLLTKSTVRQVVVGPITLTDTSALAKLLPLAVSYAYLEIVSLLYIRGLLMRTVATITHERYPFLWSRGFTRLIFPASVLNTFEILVPNNSGIKRRILLMLRGLFFAALVGLPLEFLVYSAWYLVSRYGLWDYLVLVSLLGTIVFTFQSIVFIVSANS